MHPLSLFFSVDLFCFLPHCVYEKKGWKIMTSIPEIFGSNVFSTAVMKERLPKKAVSYTHLTLPTKLEV